MVSKTTTAILVDGGFYRKRARALFGKKTPQDRANELYAYCLKHISDMDGGDSRRLYRIFYYDCPPIENIVFNPVTGKNVNLQRQPIYQWSKDFFEALLSKRKVALRLGRLSTAGIRYILRPETTKDICAGRRDAASLTDDDLELRVEQKGVDMKIGIDIAHLAYKHLVEQVILISGDSDFVPVAKLARREGLDVILDPMGAHTAPDLREHVDGVKSHL